MQEKQYTGKVTNYHMIEGAKEARGLTVIIDVFRAFSLECCLYDFGADLIRPVGAIEEALAFREQDPGCVLIGERHGARLPGFDFGNSPSQVDPAAIRGREVIHTTSAGTQGIVNASHAEEILTGSFLNAKAIAAYIIDRSPSEVSLVAMGNEGIRPAEEDELCALYIKSLLEGQPLPDLEARLAALEWGGGAHFFDPARQAIYPEADFHMCIRHDIFDFVLKIEKDSKGFISRRYRKA